jgi:hypothetical protein
MNFLTILRPAGGLVILTANMPDTAPWPTRTFELPAEQAEAVAWCEKMAAEGHNVYYQHAVPLERFTSRMGKAGISAVHYLHADLDWKAGDGRRLKASPEMKAAKVAELKALLHPPGLIIDSGNGIQALWRLKHPVPVDLAERACKALGETLGADAGTWNADRLLRVPGFTNLPSAKKKASGLGPAETAILYESQAAYELEAFPLADIKFKEAVPVGCDIEEMGEAELEALRLPASLACIIREGRDPDSTNLPRDDSRSGWLMKAVTWLASLGVSDGEIMGILLYPYFDISASVYDAKGYTPEAYARRQVANAKAYVAKQEADDLALLADEQEEICTDELFPEEIRALKDAAAAKAKSKEKERAATAKAKEAQRRTERLRDALKDWA